MSTRPIARVSLVALALASGAALAFAPSCSIFSGVTYEPPAVDAGHPHTVAYLSLADAARVCTLATSCQANSLGYTIPYATGLPTDTGNYSSCMTWLAGPIPDNHPGIDLQREVLQCVARATTCAQASACLPFDFLAPGNPECADAGPGAQKCLSAEVGLYCGDVNFPPQLLHCDSKMFGTMAKCAVGMDKAVYCTSVGTCPESDSCVGEELAFCNQTANLPIRIDCTVFGTTCGINTDGGFVDCLNGGLCTDTAARCQGDVAAVCDGQVLDLFDCPRMGAKCVDDLGTAACVFPSAACGLRDPGINACEGTNVSLCIAGSPMKFDCASIGKQCKSGAGCI